MAAVNLVIISPMFALFSLFSFCFPWGQAAFFGAAVIFLAGNPFWGLGYSGGSSIYFFPAVYVVVLEMSGERRIHGRGTREAVVRWCTRRFLIALPCVAASNLPAKSLWTLYRAIS
ncbi:hypothetical protein B0H19DRAFT_1192325 [Mycena capillaripes]|nr:hypothetical protein B0H19DRAFT_1192325 [Mycena capillaripes]